MHLASQVECPSCQADLSGEFYTLIPHDFGFKKMYNFIIRTKVSFHLGICVIICVIRLTRASYACPGGGAGESRHAHLPR